MPSAQMSLASKRAGGGEEGGHLAGAAVDMDTADMADSGEARELTAIINSVAAVEEYALCKSCDGCDLLCRYSPRGRGRGRGYYTPY